VGVFGEDNASLPIWRDRTQSAARWAGTARHVPRMGGFRLLLRRDANGMRKILGFLMTVALGAGLMAMAYEFHVVRTPERFQLVRKQPPDWRDAYVDVRGWKSRDWSAHPVLKRNVAQNRLDSIMDKSGSVPLPPPWYKSISFSGSASEEEEETGELPDDMEPPVERQPAQDAESEGETEEFEPVPAPRFDGAARPQHSESPVR